MPKIEWKWEDDDGVEHVEQIPAKYGVCSDCEGEGSVLNESMRYHAYTQEEFNEEFTDEDKAEYFKQGGIYDVQCPTCHGKRVEAVADYDSTEWTPELKAKYRKHLEDEARYAAEERAERRREAMMCGEY